MEKAKGMVTKGITLKLVAILAPLTIIFASLLVMGFYTVFILKGDATDVNYAGQVRYRSYQLAVLVNEYPTLKGVQGTTHPGLYLNLWENLRRFCTA